MPEMPIVLRLMGAGGVSCSLVSWDKVQGVMEHHEDGKFSCTRIYFVEGGTKWLQVGQTAEQIYAQLEQLTAHKGKGPKPPPHDPATCTQGFECHGDTWPDSYYEEKHQ